MISLFLVAAAGPCAAQNFSATVSAGAIQGPAEVLGSGYYTAVSTVTITNNTSGARGFFIVTEIAVTNGGGTATITTPIVVNANSTQTVTNQNGKKVSVGGAGDKTVTAKTKVKTDTNEDVSADWVLFAPLSIFVLQGADPPPYDSYN